MNLEVGMYVRSKINGRIGKITDIEEFEELGQIVKRYIVNNNYNLGFCSTEKDSVKASHNIIDILEVGDYVNGQVVTQIIPNNRKLEPSTMIYTGTNYYVGLYNEHIKSIVTKENFENMSYKVGD